MQELALSSGRNLLRPSLRETPLRTPFWDSLSTRVFCILIRTHPSRATRRTGRPRWILEEKFSGKSISVDTLLKCLSPEYRANFLFFLFRYESSLRITWVLGTGGLADELQDWFPRLRKKSESVVHFHRSPSDLVTALLQELACSSQGSV